MLILLVRHALAGKADPEVFPDDSLRPLVALGKRTQARVSRRLERRGLVPRTILSSPWRRAWQTAGILAEETGVGKKKRIACPALADDPDVAALAKAVGRRDTDEVVALVGHEPWMSELASLLLTGDPRRLAVAFPKSGVMGIDLPEFAAGAGELRFFFTP